ncbi:hypothetical protein BUALT_Bualt10G0014700 [Buddleja alternifolia]|uniref:C2H2-type domain-containing protein n=1 Tax=Buddleja alternifolia TaxID=168488 RepID=A0AAV6WW93_9LAMI|nr:hypothetical protein BUALT_Bualt10G0014700 [Buddleja alternifolia]
MWNKKQQMPEDNDDSWEVRAFEEDTMGNLMGCTWPPRSYTCTFCRREFRSAQALGGHMNVHRRDRAKLHEPSPFIHSLVTPNKAPPSTLLFPTQQLLANGLCLLYSLPDPNGAVLMRKPTNGILDFPSAAAQSVASSICRSSNTEPSASNSNDNNDSNCVMMSVKDSAIEDIDLELRLGRKSPPPAEGG